MAGLHAPVKVIQGRQPRRCFIRSNSVATGGRVGHASVMQALAIYDMDKTITQRATYAAWLLFWARRRAPWRLGLLPLSGLLALLYLLKLLGRSRLKEFNHALLMGDHADPAAVAATAVAFAAQQIATNIRADALVQIARDRTEGRRIVIATASYGFYARAIAAQLGIDDVIATGVVTDASGVRARIAGENCYGAAKRRMVEAWLKAQHLTPAPIRFYSDHVSDAPMFERAGEPVAANPNRALAVLARTRGWPVVAWS